VCAALFKLSPQYLCSYDQVGGFGRLGKGSLIGVVGSGTGMSNLWDGVLVAITLFALEENSTCMYL